MPNRELIYDEVIKQSQANVKALSEKLKAFDLLHDDIIKLKDDNNKLPKFFDDKFKEISKLSENYTEKLGVKTLEFLKGNNELFTFKIQEISGKIIEIGSEISRLKNTDFLKLFKNLEENFIVQARKDIGIELIKVDSKIVLMSEIIDILRAQLSELKIEIEKLRLVDLEKHFDKLQKTLSDIFGAINSLNSSFTITIQTLNSIVQSNSNIQNRIEKVSSEIDAKFEQSKVELEKTSENINNKMILIENQNSIIQKGIRTNRLLGLIGFGIIITILILKFFIIKK